MKKVLLGLMVLVMPLLMVITILGGYLGNAAVFAAGNSWLSGYSNRVSLTVSGFNPPSPYSGTVTNFPILIQISNSSGLNKANLSQILSQSNANRHRIAVTTSDGTTQCPVEIERWDSTQIDLWAKAPSLSNGSTFYLYFNGSADNPYVGDTGSTIAESVWDNHYVAVYHMLNTNGTLVDSTANHNNGTIYGSPATVAGPSGYALDFSNPESKGNNNTEYVSIPDANGFSINTTGFLTVQWWMNNNAANMYSSRSDDQVRVINKVADNNGEWTQNYYGQVNSARSEAVANYLFNLSGGLGTGAFTGNYDTQYNTWPPGKWNMFVSRYDNGSTTVDTGRIGASAITYDVQKSHWVSMYANGGFRMSQSMNSTNTITPQNGTAPVLIAHSVSTDNSWYDGQIGELRFSNIARQDNWLLADYLTENDSLFNYGTIETNSNATSTTPPSTPTPTPTPTPAPTPTPIPTPTPTPVSTTNTFGLNSGNRIWNQSPDILDVMRFQNTAGTGILNKLSLLFNTSAPDGSVRMGVYSDNNGKPGNLLLDAGQAAITNGWVTISGLNLPVTANTYYWLAFTMSAGNSAVYQTGQPANSHYWLTNNYGSLPNVYPTSGLSSNNDPYVIQATVASSSITPTPTPVSTTNTFGLNSGNRIWNQSPDILDIMRFQNTAGTGTLNKLSLLFNTSAPDGSVRMGVYSDNNGKPGNLLLDAGQATITNGWVTISGLNLPVTANTYYWLAFTMSAGNSAVYQTGQPANSHYWLTNNYGSLPNVYPTSGLYSNNDPYVIQATVVTP